MTQEHYLNGLGRRIGSREAALDFEPGSLQASWLGGWYKGSTCHMRASVRPCPTSKRHRSSHCRNFGSNPTRSGSCETRDIGEGEGLRTINRKRPVRNLSTCTNTSPLVRLRRRPVIFQPESMVALLTVFHLWGWKPAGILFKALIRYLPRMSVSVDRVIHCSLRAQQALDPTTLVCQQSPRCTLVSCTPPSSW